MAKPLASKAQNKWYTLEEEKDEKLKTEFHLQGLTVHQYTVILAEFNPNAKNSYGAWGAETLQTAIEQGVIGWKNFGDLEFTTENTEFIQPVHKLELLSEIIALSELKDDEKKT